ncbi:MAG: DUF2156 domain-containing protein [Spirochaetaceae bacterium]|jgi:hypothetical protein|nr:DUF2156 domain-containing protein [Spirochaetaceae bacterium]
MGTIQGSGLIPSFPEWAAIRLEHKEALHPALQMTADGVSEFTFSNLYLFRKRYNYQLSSLGGDNVIISGEREGKKFFSTPFACPPREVLDELFSTHSYWKNISESVLEGNAESLSAQGIELAEDRDNFDYLYFREDLAKLSGKKYHKKRNLVNAFMLAYPEHGSKPLTRELVGEAQAVLEIWRIDKHDEGDYIAASEALDLFEQLNMEGAIFYVKGRPAGWCLGEGVARGTSFALHFEKGVDAFKGIYQFINQRYAESLSESYTYINREQDLGDEGLRQSKETYRPCGFVKKWTGKKQG